jgi:hypothetical protein
MDLLLLQMQCLFDVNSGGSGGLVLDFRNFVLWIWSFGGGYGGFGGSSPISRWTPTTTYVGGVVLSGSSGGCTLSRGLSSLIGWP